MNKYFLITALVIPTIIQSMDKNLVSDFSKMSINKGAKLPVSSAPKPTPVSVEVASPAVTPSAANNNNNTTTNQYADLSHLTQRLKTHIKQCNTDTTQALQETAILVRDDLLHRKECLYGPILYALSQRAQELESALTEKEGAKHKAVQNIATTIEGYLHDFPRQEELLKYSIYPTPPLVRETRPTSPYINFYSAISSFIIFLNYRSAQERSDYFFKIKDALDQYSKVEIHGKGYANAELICNSKKAALASYLNDVAGIGNMTSCKDLLQSWLALTPAHIGAELAYGEKIHSPAPTQGDRCAVVHQNDYDYIAVFDGHGGNGGSAASSFCRGNLLKFITLLHKNFDQEFLSGNQDLVHDLIEKSFKAWNTQVIDHLNKQWQALPSSEREKNPALLSQGSTALLCFIPRDPNKKSLLVSLGDSRAYLNSIENNIYTPLIPYLHNTSNPDEVLRIQKEHPGDPSAIIAERVGGVLSVTRAFGNVCNKYITTEPYIHWFKLPRNAVLILGTDGLFEKQYAFQKEEDRVNDICATVDANKFKTAQEIACNLMEQSNPFDGDNKTVIVYKS